MTNHDTTPPAGGTPAAVVRDRRLSEWTRIQEEIAALHAEANEVLADALDDALAEVECEAGLSQAREIPLRSMVAEYAAAARMSEVTVEGLAFDARRLVTLLPDTHRALADGQITLGHAREIAQVPIPADAAPDTIAEFEFRVLDYATSTTPRRTRVFGRAVAQKLFPTDQAARHRIARDARHIRVTDFDDGMSDLTLHTSTVIARAAYDRATQLARATQDAAREQARTLGPRNATTGSTATDSTATTPGSGAGPDPTDSGEEDRDTRTLDQVRADVASDLLLAALPVLMNGDTASRIHGRVQVTLPIRTAANLTDQGAELDGIGLVEAELVRELAGLADGWDRLFIDPVTDSIVRTDRYRPTTSMRRFLRARDQHCRFPGCRAPVTRCQIDHTHDHAKGGPTTPSNLSHLCTRHHALKHPDIPDPHRWTLKQLSGGVLQWTSPTGRHYIDEPPPRVTFTDSAPFAHTSRDPDPPWVTAPSAA